MQNPLTDLKWKGFQKWRKHNEHVTVSLNHFFRWWFCRGHPPFFVEVPWKLAKRSEPRKRPSDFPLCLLFIIILTELGHNLIVDIYPTRTRGLFFHCSSHSFRPWKCPWKEAPFSTLASQALSATFVVDEVRCGSLMPLGTWRFSSGSPSLNNSMVVSGSLNRW